MDVTIIIIVISVLIILSILSGISIYFDINQIKITRLAPTTFTETTTVAPITFPPFVHTPTTQAPIITTKSPITTKEPTTTIKAPITTTKKPTITTWVPLTLPPFIQTPTTQAPIITTKSPITTKEPTTTTKAPTTTWVPLTLPPFIQTPTATTKAPTATWVPLTLPPFIQTPTTQAPTTISPSMNNMWTCYKGDSPIGFITGEYNAEQASLACRMRNIFACGSVECTARKSYNCYNKEKNTLDGNVDIYWGYTQADAEWACNNWVPKCSGGLCKASEKTG